MTEHDITRRGAGTGDDGDGQGARSESSWQQKARAFARARLRLYALRTVAGLLFLFLFWYSGASAALFGAFDALIPWWWAAILVFLLAYQAITDLLFLPFSYYGGFRLQHRFGLSRQSLRGWLSDWAKSVLIGALFFVVGLEAIYLVVAALPDAWWWVLAAGLTAVALLLTYVAPVLLLPIFYKRSPLEDRDLAERIRSLAERAGARISRISVIDMSRRTVAANAALAGIGRTRQVLLGDTMLQQFTPDEVETVFAHELGHHVHGDIWKGLAAEVAGIWAGFYLLYAVVRPGLLHLGAGDIVAPQNLPLLLLLGEAASLALMPLINALSRRYEAEADAFAVRLSRKPAAYSDALYRLAKQNLAELWPPRWEELLLYTHPAIGRRMERVREAGRPVP